MATSEIKFRKKLIDDIKNEIPGVIDIEHNNPQFINGIHDLIVLGKNGKYAMLETKKSSDSSRRALQEYYVDKYAQYTYSKFVDPTNRDEVMQDLKEMFKENNKEEQVCIGMTTKS